MSNFLKMFRSKKVDKENDSPTEETKERKSICRNGNLYNSTRKDRRASMAITFDDTFANPSAPYHTVTQPKQTKGTRSCIGRDEYERYGQSRPPSSRDHSALKSGSNFGKRKFYESKMNTDFSSLKIANFDEELLDSDESFASEDERRTSRYRKEVVRNLKEEVEYLKYRLRHEIEKKLHYKGRLICEQQNVQKILNQRQRMEYDISVYKNSLGNLRNEMKIYQSKIAKLEKQLKSMSTRNISKHPFSNVTFTTASSTSNEISSVDEAVIDGGAGEMLCSVSETTLPHQNPFVSVADSIDEVKNFRKNDTNSSFEVPRNDHEVVLEKIDLDSTLLNDTETDFSSNANECTLKAKDSKRQRAASDELSLRRSLSDSDIRRKRRSVAFRMTNL